MLVATLLLIGGEDTAPDISFSMIVKALKGYLKQANSGSCPPLPQHPKTAQCVPAAVFGFLLSCAALSCLAQRGAGLRRQHTAHLVPKTMTHLNPSLWYRLNFLMTAEVSDGIKKTTEAEKKKDIYEEKTKKTLKCLKLCLL